MNESHLDEAYERISRRYEMYLKRTRFWDRLGYVAILLSMVSIIGIPLVTVSVSLLELEIPILTSLSVLELQLLTLGSAGALIILSSVSSRLSRKRGRSYRTIADERLFLKVYSTMKNLSSYLDDELEYHKIDALQSFEKVVDKVSDWNYGNVGIVKKTLGSTIEKFKENVKEILLPTIAEGDSGSHKKTLFVLKDLANYLLEPTLERLMELNKSIETLPRVPYERIGLSKQISSLIKAHVLLQHFIVALVCVIVGISEFLISTHVLNFSRDVSYAASVTTIIGLFGSYSALRRRKEG